MKNIAFILSLLCATLIAQSSVSPSSPIKELPLLHPKLGTHKSYTPKEQLKWEKAIRQLYASEGNYSIYANLPTTEKELVDSLEMGYGPITEGVACSWYSGGGPDTVYASSCLPPQGTNTYGCENIHDFNLLTPWAISGKDAIGQTISFRFAPFSPRINTIVIWNGYIKNKKLWKDNSRVAKFKLLINDKPTAILALEDVDNTQSFEIQPIHSTDSLKPLILTLEIAEIYRGNKYNDVVVSEINFDGLDVH